MTYLLPSRRDRSRSTASAKRRAKSRQTSFTQLEQLLLLSASPIAELDTTDAVTFTFEDLGNGQKVDSPFEVHPLVDIVGHGKNQGAAIYDSDPSGGNRADPDLMVGLGNILILQSNDHPGGCGDYFNTPDDSAAGGSLFFHFADPVATLSVDLVDIDSGGATKVILTDSAGLHRTYDVAGNWTNEVPYGSEGFDTLDLTTLCDQVGEGGATATASEQAGFDWTSVISMEVKFSGSAGLDNVSFVPYRACDPPAPTPEPDPPAPAPEPPVDTDPPPPEPEPEPEPEPVPPAPEDPEVIDPPAPPAPTPPPTDPAPPVPEFSVNLDFGPSGSVVPTGYQLVTSSTTYTPQLGFGWTSGTLYQRDRGVGFGSDLSQDFVFTTQASFAVDVLLEPGVYDVTITMGDGHTNTPTRDNMGVFLEGVQVDSVTTQPGRYVTSTYQVVVTDGQLNLSLQDLGGADPYVIINSMEVTYVGPASTV